jgi:flavin-dependent dehydrogenase
MALYDAIIIGGGPAGAMCGALLAQHGRKVAILEKESFPRYIVGESMLPYCYFPLDRIGMIEKLKETNFPKKHSVQFVGRSGRVSQPFYFFKHFKHEASQTWQVLRSEFDEMMLNNAREKGAHVEENTAATSFIIDKDDAVKGVIDQHGKKWQTKIVIDASGRQGFSSSRLGWRVRDEYLKKMAIWQYYKGAKRDEGIDEGATTIAYLPQNGWFWYIPLPNDMVSVGIVADREYLYQNGKDPKEIFTREIKNNLWIEDHLAAATSTGEIRVTGDYSYRSKHCAKEGLILIGDAFTFLDPVFSSGLFFALKGGELVADIIHEGLDREDLSPDSFNEYATKLCQGIEDMRKLVYAFYDDKFSFASVLKKYPEFNGDITDCLIGNLFKDFDPLFKAVAEFASLPAPLKHGSPLCQNRNEG